MRPRCPCSRSPRWRSSCWGQAGGARGPHSRQQDRQTLRLSILDQSPIVSGHSPAEALRATIELARRAEALAYHRYWLAEHHTMRGLADPCPEILLGQVAAATERMRVGTGGVLLPYYSPLKVAEVFRM